MVHFPRSTLHRYQSSADGLGAASIPRGGSTNSSHWPDPGNRTRRFRSESEARSLGREKRIPEAAASRTFEDLGAETIEQSTRSKKDRDCDVLD